MTWDFVTTLLRNKETDIDFSKHFQVGKEYNLKCSAKGFPVPDVSWMFKPCSSYDECDNAQMRSLQVDFMLFRQSNI